jgi:hypothetical protein
MLSHLLHALPALLVAGTAWPATPHSGQASTSREKTFSGGGSGEAVGARRRVLPAALVRRRRRGRRRWGVRVRDDARDDAAAQPGMRSEDAVVAQGLDARRGGRARPLGGSSSSVRASQAEPRLGLFIR